jgi:hypothetical protein
MGESEDDSRSANFSASATFPVAKTVLHQMSQEESAGAADSPIPIICL